MCANIRARSCVSACKYTSESPSTLSWVPRRKEERAKQNGAREIGWSIGTSIARSFIVVSARKGRRQRGTPDAFW